MVHKSPDLLYVELYPTVYEPGPYSVLCSVQAEFDTFCTTESVDTSHHGQSKAAGQWLVRTAAYQGHGGMGDVCSHGFRPHARSHPRCLSLCQLSRQSQANWVG